VGAVALAAGEGGRIEQRIDHRVERGHQGVVHDALEQAVIGAEEAVFQNRVIMGQLAFADAEFDRAVSVLNNLVLASVQGNRDSAVYRAFFPTGRTLETVRAAYADDQRAAQRVAQAAQANPGAASEAAVKAVTDAAQAVQQAVTALAGQGQAVAQAQTAVRVAQVAWVRAYNRAHPELQLLFPDQQGIVESFFVQAPIRRKPAGDDADELPPPA